MAVARKTGGGVRFFILIFLWDTFVSFSAVIRLIVRGWLVKSTVSCNVVILSRSVCNAMSMQCLTVTIDR